MGHNTENLVGCSGLENYNGIILSPVNRTLSELVSDTNKFRSQISDIVLDPQLYVPNYARGKLGEHSYYPSDLDTADLSSQTWWSNLHQNLAAVASELNINTLASPAIIPRIFNEDYVEAICSNYMHLKQCCDREIKCILTITIPYSVSSDLNSVRRFTSIMSRFDIDGFYVVFMGEVEPRREITDVPALSGAMFFGHLLSRINRNVIISHCSSDMILYKYAGIRSCATGKYFNLRRFTRSRFEEPPSGGGGQLAYWFEHSLLGFLRTADIARVLASEEYRSLIGTAFSSNEWADSILMNLNSGNPAAWVADGWKQYLSWFANTEHSLNGGDSNNLISGWLKDAEINWLNLEDSNILFEEPRNNGDWIRPWRLALSDYDALE